MAPEPRSGTPGDSEPAEPRPHGEITLPVAPKRTGDRQAQLPPPSGRSRNPNTDAGLPWLAPAPTHTHPVGSCPGGTEAAPYHPKATLNKQWSPEPGHPPALLQECQADPSPLVASRALGTWLNCILRPPSARDLQKWSTRPGTARCQHTGSQDTGSAPATLETPDRPGGHPPPTPKPKELRDLRSPPRHRDLCTRSAAHPREPPPSRARLPRPPRVPF